MLTLDDDGIPYPAEISIIGSFPNSQHKVIMIKVRLNFQLNDPRPIPWCKFQKANWKQFKGYIKKSINRIPRCINALLRFQKLLFKAAKINIPRGFKKNELPGWIAESKELYRQYTDHQTAEKGKKRLASLDAVRRQRWIETVEHFEMKKNSREAWALLKNLLNFWDKKNVLSYVTWEYRTLWIWF